MKTGWGEIKADRCRRVIHAAPTVGLDFREAGGEIRVHHWRLDEAELRLRAVRHGEGDQRAGGDEGLRRFLRRFAKQRAELGVLEIDRAKGFGLDPGF